jgi:phenylpyruvate tautomerase PptA (4-oxalocrotonate tautomerase family)
VLVEILLSVGRSVKVKRKILADLVEGLRRDPGIDPENAMVVFKETQWENWSFAGGRQIHVG